MRVQMLQMLADVCASSLQYQKLLTILNVTEVFVLKYWPFR